MPHATELQALLDCCAVLFGPEVQLSREFLQYLQPGGLKSAYRKRALLTHPDRLAPNDPTFLAVQEAYARLMGYLQQRDGAGGGRIHGPFPATTVSPPVIIRPFSLPGTAGAGSPLTSIERLYRGPLPQRVLRFGNYLYYSGLTNWRTITRILVWQRLERPRLGEISRCCGLLTEAEIISILSRSATGRRFGETAMALGLLTDVEVAQLLARQLGLQKKFGTILLERQLVDRTGLQELLRRFKRHNAAAGRRGEP